MLARTNYIRHLNAFFTQVRKDDRLHANHISLYMALFQIWNQYRFQACFPILRDEVISLCHIGSFNTYTRCLKDLHGLGYIAYQPAPQRGAPSVVSIRPFKNADAGESPTQLSLFEKKSSGMSPLFELEPSYYEGRLFSGEITNNRKNETGPRRKNETNPSRNFDTGSVAKLRHFNNKHINNKKRESKIALAHKKNNKKNESKHDARSAGARSLDTAPPPPRPSLQEVQQFFLSSGYPDKEGRKFYYHYQANGWRQGLIIDWQAAAHKWMLNDKPQKNRTHDIGYTKPAQPGRLHTNEDKSYSDPL